MTKKDKDITSQPKPAVVPPITGLTVENQEAADREVEARERLAREAKEKPADQG